MVDKTELIVKMIQMQGKSIERIDGNIDSIFHKVNDFTATAQQVEWNTKDIISIKAQPEKKLARAINIVGVLMVGAGLVITIWGVLNAHENKDGHVEDRVPSTISTDGQMVTD